MADLQQPSDADLNNAGVPPTLTVREPRTVGGLFSDGAVILDANTYTQVTAIAGALGIRLRGKFTCGGTLSFRYRRPPGAGGKSGGNAAIAYDSTLNGPAVDVVVVANTEFCVPTIEPVGEAYLAIKFDPTADGVVTFFDVLAA